MKRSAVSLVELLIALALIALLMALLLPVLLNARRRAYETTCLSNMRQLAAALAQYRQDYGDFPPFAQYVFPYVKDRRIFLCPHDHADAFGGVNWFGGGNLYARQNRISLSYFYFADPVNNYKRQIELLPLLDPNHGVVACLLHGSCDSGCRDNIPPAIENCCQGLTLRVRLDGSVQRVRTYLRPCIDPYDNAPTAIRDRWNLFTDVPCPPDVCTRNCY
jgi:type II secretory pathway pseudopilin PulG